MRAITRTPPCTLPQGLGLLCGGCSVPEGVWGARRQAAQVWRGVQGSQAALLAAHDSFWIKPSAAALETALWGSQEKHF